MLKPFLPHINDQWKPKGARGSKAVSALAGRPYRVLMRVLAVLLGGFALLLFREGLRQLAVI
jgi:hypothetical protein